MTAPTDLARMVPGFDFLQGLLKNAGAGLPAMGQWVAPTLDPKELDKRIQELKTVQFWLEQNARLLATTVQAMEVQRMTLSTLQTMNLPLADLGNALQLKWPPSGAADPPAPGFASAAPAAAAAPALVPAATPASSTSSASPASPVAPRSGARAKAAGGDGVAAAAGVVDPLQWWGALTQQFAQLATQAMQGAAGDGAGVAAGAKARTGPARAAADAPPRAAGSPRGGAGAAAPPRVPASRPRGR